MWHILDELLDALDSLGDISCQGCKTLCKVLLLGAGLTILGPVLCIVCDLTIGIKSLDGTVAFLKDSGGSLEKRLDCFD